jgi:hypothetical protein
MSQPTLEPSEPKSPTNLVAVANLAHSELESLEQAESQDV